MDTGDWIYEFLAIDSPFVDWNPKPFGFVCKPPIHLYKPKSLVARFFE